MLITARSPNSALPLHIQKQCTIRSFSGGGVFLSLATKGFQFHIKGRLPKPLVSRQYPMGNLVIANPALYHTASIAHPEDLLSDSNVKKPIHHASQFLDSLIHIQKSCSTTFCVYNSETGNTRKGSRYTLSIVFNHLYRIERKIVTVAPSRA